MSAQIIDGKKTALQLREEIGDLVETWIGDGNPKPFLSVILVGENPASASYVRGKSRACAKANIGSDTIILDSKVSEIELLERIEVLNKNEDVHGILVQLPLPDHINEDRVISAISPEKDVDGFHPVNAGKLLIGQKAFLPATPAGLIELLRRYNIETSGKRAVVIGRSNIVGKPIAVLLARKGTDCTVTLCHSRTKNLADRVREADIVVAAIGRPEIITGDMLKPGAVVLDVGINRVKDETRERGYRLVGDVDFDSAKEVASFITPVPGGVGPMTIALLLKNTFDACKNLNEDQA